MQLHSCDGDNKVFYPGFSADYSKPFILSMTIVTKPECNGCSGGIFSDQDDPNRIGILWSAQKLNIKIANGAVQKDTSAYQMSNQLRIKTRASGSLPLAQQHDVSIIFDGSKCKVYVNGDLVGPEFDCSGGFGSMRSQPNLCKYDNMGNGWNGLIENLRFDGRQFKGTNHN